MNLCHLAVNLHHPAFNQSCSSVNHSHPAVDRCIPEGNISMLAVDLCCPEVHHFLPAVKQYVMHKGQGLPVPTLTPGLS